MRFSSNKENKGFRQIIPSNMASGLGRAGLILLTVSLVIFFRDPFIGDWDAVDYTVLAVRGAPSSMALGRTLFIGYNHALWRIAHSLFNLDPAHAYLLFQWAVIAQVPFALIACGKLAHAVTDSQRTALLATLLVGTTPVFVLYGGQVMTEIPALLLLSLALWLYWRGATNQRYGLLLASAALLGAGVNLRETTAFFGTWLLLAPLAARWQWRRREIITVLLAVITFLLCAFGPFVVMYGLDLGNFRMSWHGWLASMRMESAQHPVSWRNIGPFAGLFAVNAPLFLLAVPALKHEWQRYGFSPVLALGLTGVLATCLLVLNYSTTINARYVLTGLPALAPVISQWLLDFLTARPGNNPRRAFIWACILVCGLGLVRNAWLVRQQARLAPQRQAAKNYLTQLANVPDDAVIMAGGQTVAVTYYRDLGYGHWSVIGTGGGWPGAELVPLITRSLANGQRIFLDTDRRGWAVCGWPAAETRALPELARHFRFSRVNTTLYEIRWPTATDASDDPQLDNLLPENRPDELRRCFSLALK